MPISPFERDFSGSNSYWEKEIGLANAAPLPAHIVEIQWAKPELTGGTTARGADQIVTTKTRCKGSKRLPAKLISGQKTGIIEGLCGRCGGTFPWNSYDRVWGFWYYPSY